MTERVYYTSDATDGRAQIIACTAKRMAVTPSNWIGRCFTRKGAVNRRTVDGLPGRWLRRWLCAAKGCCIFCRNPFPSVKWR